MAAHQAIGVRGGAGADDAVDHVHHHEGPADGGQHLGGSFGERGSSNSTSTSLPLLLADPERQHAEDA